jgi:Na+/proline symporter
MNSIHDDVGNVLDVMLVMMMVMLTMMLEMMLTMSFMINNIYDFKSPRLCNMLGFLSSP